MGTDNNNNKKKSYIDYSNHDKSTVERNEREAVKHREIREAVLTVAFAQGGGIFAAGRGKPGGAGEVDLNAVVLAEGGAEAGDGGGALEGGLDAGAAPTGGLALRAPLLHVRQAADEPGHRRRAVDRRRRRPRRLRRRAGR